MIRAAEGLDAGAAAAATLVAHLHDLPKEAIDVTMARAGWNAFGAPPAGLIEAADHFGLSTENGDLARDPERLGALLSHVGLAAIGVAEAGPVRIVAHGGHLPEGKPFLVATLNGAEAGVYRALDHRELLKIFHDAARPMPLILAHA